MLKPGLFPIVVGCRDGAKVFRDGLGGVDESLRIVLIHQPHSGSDFGIRLHELDGHARKLDGKLIASCGVLVFSVGSQFSSIIRILMIGGFGRVRRARDQHNHPNFHWELLVGLPLCVFPKSGSGFRARYAGKKVYSRIAISGFLQEQAGRKAYSGKVVSVSLKECTQSNRQKLCAPACVFCELFSKNYLPTTFWYTSGWPPTPFGIV